MTRDELAALVADHDQPGAVLAYQYQVQQKFGRIAMDLYRTGQLVMVPSDKRRFYIDCEFDGHDGPLLSFAMVTDDGDGIHIVATDGPVDCSPWVATNVVPLMDCHNAPKSAFVSTNEFGGVLRAFMGDCERPVIVADSPVDIGRFCRVISTSADGEWASADYPAMRFEVHNVDCYPTTLEGAVQHNAWWDAMALRAVLTSMGAKTDG